MRVHEFWSHVDKSGSCWEWHGLMHKGYGRYSGTGAHRVAYLLMVGPIDDGLELDHLCMNTTCVNPEHLEPVTRSENMRRRVSAKSCCRNGHEYTDASTYMWRGRRVCRICNTAAVARSKARREATA